MNAQGNHGIVPLPDLVTNGWAFALAKWDILHLEADLANLLTQTYDDARQLNASFQMRGQFSMLMVPLRNYQQVLGLLDNSQVQSLNRYVASSGQLIQKLASEIA